MKIVNAHSRRVNSRRVGGAVHLECLILRAEGARGQSPGKTATFARLRSSTARSGFVNEVLIGEEPGQLSPPANTEGFVHSHPVAKQWKWSVQSLPSLSSVLRVADFALQDDATSEISASFLGYFDLEPQAFPWRDAIPHTIESRRSLLSDLLFFDTLLLSGGVRDPATLYPPTDVASLSNLLHAIENSNYDRLKKDSLVYFLLKWHQDGRETRFADERCILPHFCALCDAYWHLDTGWNVEVCDHAN